MTATRVPPFLHILCAVMALLGSSAPAAADRDEAQWSLRPLVGVTRIREDGAPGVQREYLGGASLGLAYGLTDGIDLSADLIAFGTASSTFPNTTFALEHGELISGTYTRRSAGSLLFLGPTFRLGVVWVPVATVAVGVGARYRSSGVIQELMIYPPSRGERLELDVGAMARIGLERRLSRRVTVGAYASAFASGGPSVPTLPAAYVSLGASWVYYPLWR
jgi:hypothetical protein